MIQKPIKPNHQFKHLLQWLVQNKKNTFDDIISLNRVKQSGDCKNETLVEEEDCNPQECPCIIDGVVWGPNDTIDDECRYW